MRAGVEPSVRELPAEKLSALRRNIFGPGQAAIADWHRFPWHHDQRGEVQSDKVQSSQALAIDVFGTIKASSDASRDAVMDAIACSAGLSVGGPWQVDLEWCDPQNLLREPTPTQVDVLVESPRTILVIECKFTEAPGSCSQTARMRSGRAIGQRQCNGRYEPQSHPATGVTSHCVLSGKRIRYWDVIPDVFALDPLQVYDPCPFARGAYQWMRNMVLAAELGRTSGKASRCMIAFAAGGNFPTEKKIRNSNWLPPLRTDRLAPFAMSFQQIAELAAQVDGDIRWTDLSHWVDSKLDAVRSKTRSG